MGDLGNQRVEGRGVVAHQAVGGDLIGRAATSDHIGGDGPRGTCEADQGGIGRQFAFDDTNGLINGVKGLVDNLKWLQAGEVGGGGDRRKARAFARLEPQVGAKGLRQQQNVGEQDGGVKAIAADGL